MMQPVHAPVPGQMQMWHEPISEDAEEELTCLASVMPPATATGTAGRMPSFRHTRST